MGELNQKKVEALRDKWSATIMMHNEEYTGARQKLLNAQQLCPELDKISLMLTICDILLLASSVRLSYNEIDFHCILDLINPLATYSDARCYLHNLVTSINGIKYEFPGAELALKVVQNALNMLSDREKHLHNGFRHDSGPISSNKISASPFERCRDISNPDVEQSNWEESIEVDHISPYRLLFSHKIPAQRLMGGKDEGLYELDQMALPNNLIQHIGVRNPIKGSNSGENKLCVGEFQSEGKFLKYKISAADFAPGQVWAIYCGKDIMPRQYALVNSMVSDRQICVKNLEPELVHKDENKWREDLPIVCGTFKQGNSNVILGMSQFSHLVKHVQGTTRPHYMIYPQKGEIWAMYKNWNRKWEHNDYEKCQCQMVEIISDFSEENGIKVAKLEEVNNCLTFFRRQQHEGFDLSRTISEAEMLSFSHRVLAYRVPGIERFGISEDSWHLEPHAIPYQQKV